jgi:small subunit ribosomal protein S8
MVNDPIADLINQLKNAGSAGKTSVTVPYSEMRFTISELLNKEGYIKSVSKKGKKIKKYIEMDISYNQDSPKIKGVKRISKPSRRIYRKATELRPVKQGFGIMLLSTPKGIMTDKEARKEKVGGEVLFEIW